MGARSGLQRHGRANARCERPVGCCVDERLQQWPVGLGGTRLNADTAHTVRGLEGHHADAGAVIDDRIDEWRADVRGVDHRVDPFASETRAKLDTSFSDERGVGLARHPRQRESADSFFKDAAPDGARGAHTRSDRPAEGPRKSRACEVVVAFSGIVAACSKVSDSGVTATSFAGAITCSAYVLWR